MDIVSPVIPVALSVVAVVVAGLGFLIAVGAHRRLARDPGSSSGRGQHAASRGQGAPDSYEDQPRPVARYSGGAQDIDPRALRDLAIVRYDALQEMSGQLSFSVALLNSQGDGIVLSSINGRAETRTYAKTVVAGRGTQELSPEEQEAIRMARTGKGPAEQARVASKPKITSHTGAPGAIFSQIG